MHKLRSWNPATRDGLVGVRCMPRRLLLRCPRPFLGFGMCGRHIFGNRKYNVHKLCGGHSICDNWFGLMRGLPRRFLLCGRWFDNVFRHL